MSQWTCALELDSERKTVDGSASALCDAIRRGAGLRVHTTFRHGEHIDPSSGSDELIQETAEFGVTYLVDDRWAAGIMSLRQPVGLPDAFGPRPSMSFFMYNQDGQQAIARPYLDGGPAVGDLGPAPLDDHSDMPKYHQFDNWDAETNAPSHNFVYDFGCYRYWVRDDWHEVLHHAGDGVVVSGSVEDLARAVEEGKEVKVGVRGLCDDLVAGDALGHEVFVQVGSCYYYTEQQMFIAGTHPVVRVRPCIPMRYGSEAWDFGWLMCRSDGLTARRLCEPYTLEFADTRSQCAIRWFVR